MDLVACHESTRVVVTMEHTSKVWDGWVVACHESTIAVNTVDCRPLKLW